MAPALAIIVLLLTAAPAALADTQAISNVQSVQNAQNSQIFGLPPLHVILGAAGAALERVHSPVRLNTRVVVDQPAQQQHQQQQQMTYGQADIDQTVSYGQVDASADYQQQQQYAQYVSSNQPTSQPAAASEPTAAAGPRVSGYWIQNPDGTRTPLSNDDPLLAKLPGAPATPVAAGQVASGTIVAGAVIPVTTGPRQQGNSWVVDTQNFTMTDGTVINSNATAADGTIDGTVVAQGPSVVTMPVYQPQQQQQVWVPAAQGSQMMQGYYPMKSKGGMVVVSQPGMGGRAAGYGTVGKTVGWANNRPQGMGMGQVNMGQGMGQGNNMGQANVGWGMGQGQMQGNMGQGMGVPANSGSGNFADDSMNDQQQQQQQQQEQQQEHQQQQQQQLQQGASGSQPPMGPSSGFNRGTPAIMEEPSVVIVDETNQGSSSSRNSNGNTVPAQVMPNRPANMPTQQNPTGGMSGAGPKPSGASPGKTQPGFTAGGAGGPLKRRPPAMIPVNPQKGGTGDSMGG